MTGRTASPDPERVEAGRRNRLKWQGFSSEGLERLRQAALANRPWRFSTGPRTAEGKARSAANGKVRQRGPVSVRELRAELAGFHDLAREMVAARLRLAGGGPSMTDR
jgi:hypothetical protein